MTRFSAIVCLALAGAALLSWWTSGSGTFLAVAAGLWAVVTFMSYADDHPLFKRRKHLE